MDRAAQLEFHRRMKIQKRIANAFRDEWIAQRFLDLAPHRIRIELAAAAFIARQLFEAGLVELVQKKHGPFQYQYIMIAKHKPEKPGWNWWGKPIRVKKQLNPTRKVHEVVGS